MTEKQLERWTYEVFHPALWKVLPAHYTQHLPSTYAVALANSKANQVEARKVNTRSYQAQQAIAYHLQSAYLHDIWDAVLDIANHSPGLVDFKEPQLFFTAEGTKLVFQSLSSRLTLLDVMDRFEAYMETIFNMDRIDPNRFYVDLGKEICAGIYDRKPPAMKSDGQQYYHENMPYEASSVTSATPKESKLRKGGLIYSQFYGSVKEMTDAAKCKPFDNNALEEMALDPRLQRAATNIAGGHRREVFIVEAAYKASKRRAQQQFAKACIRTSPKRMASQEYC